MRQDDKTMKLMNDTVISCGNFDGMHKGHVRLIENCISIAKSNHLSSLVLSFTPHPAYILKNRNNFKLLMTEDEKRNAILALHPDYFLELDFQAIKELDPKEFIETLLIEKLHCKYFIVGQNFKFGKSQTGSLALLRQYEKNFTLLVIEDYRNGQIRISSTMIRALIAAGDVKAANSLLSKNYSITAVVVTGNQLGRSLGFPTLNFLVPKEKLLPPYGVYLSYVCMDQRFLPSITNIGLKPTVASGCEISMETHIFDFQGNLYGKKITVEILEFMRAEKKFDSLESLQHQIVIDIENAKKYFTNPS